MIKFIKNKMTILVGILALLLTSCNKEVPAGFVGMVKAPSGVKQEVLSPGYHTCWNRDKMYLFETVEVTNTLNLDILCKDELNFGFDVKVRSTIDYKNAKDLNKLLDSQGAKTVEFEGKQVLKYSILYNTYVKPVVDATARSVVSKYNTTQISNNRAKIQKSIFAEVVRKLKGTPVTISAIDLSNFDYPEVITNAMESKKKREIKIDEEEANQALEVLQIKNRDIIADLEISVKAKEAKAEAVYIRIIQSVLSERYLALKDIQARNELYKRVGPGDKIIMDTKSAALVNVGK